MHTKQEVSEFLGRSLSKAEPDVTSTRSSTEVADLMEAVCFDRHIVAFQRAFAESRKVRLSALTASSPCVP